MPGRPFHLLSLFVFLTLAPCFRAAAGPDWDPANTWVFAVGLLKFENTDEFSNFPLKNRRDVQLVEFFKSRGVPAGQIVYLQDAKAKQATIESKFSEFLAKTDENSLLIVYYCGHGFLADENSSKVFFASYDAYVGDVEGWSVNKMVKEIEASFEGSNAILLADCCHSGALANVVKRKGSEVSYACLASSTLRKSSTGNWTFTEAILAALRGDSETDLDQDGSVTLEEAENFALAEMAFAENQKIASFLSEDWSGPLILAKAGKLSDSKIGAHVEVKYGGTRYKGRITARNGGQFKVFFYGYEQSDEEWVNEDEIIWAGEE